MKAGALHHLDKGLKGCFLLSHHPNKQFPMWGKSSCLEKKKKKKALEMGTCLNMKNQLCRIYFVFS